MEWLPVALFQINFPIDNTSSSNYTNDNLRLMKNCRKQLKKFKPWKKDCKWLHLLIVIMKSSSPTKKRQTKGRKLECSEIFSTGNIVICQGASAISFLFQSVVVFAIATFWSCSRNLNAHNFLLTAQSRRFSITWKNQTSEGKYCESLQLKRALPFLLVAPKNSESYK